ncbi:hypothetical protein [Kitasatospora indigofera]|uniref:hypothetical protein n=1 Tax=Kitasatospora indigofera TaxID=67307 RepID=UPI0036D075D3
MSGIFDQELREQLDGARAELARAEAQGDADGVQAYRGRVAGLLRVAARHGVALVHEAEEEEGES